MKLFKECFLFTVMLLCICYKLTNAVNIVVKFYTKEHIFFYDAYQVEFSDVDMLQMMYHANFVKYCGNAVAKYLYKFPESFDQKRFIVKNVDITFNSPLNFLDPFKLVGTITKYGNTSVEITIMGVSNKNRKFEVMKKLFKMLRTKDIGTLLNSGLKENVLLEQLQSGATNTETVAKAMEEDTSNDKDNVKEDISHNSESSASAKKEPNPVKIEDKVLNSENKCINYFTATYTLVKVNNNGQKEAIDESFRNNHPPMTKENLELVLGVMC